MAPCRNRVSRLCQVAATLSQYSTERYHFATNLTNQHESKKVVRFLQCAAGHRCIVMAGPAVDRLCPATGRNQHYADYSSTLPCQGKAANRGGQRARGGLAGSLHHAGCKRVGVKRPIRREV
jgi:hypothetical protein